MDRIDSENSGMSIITKRYGMKYLKVFLTVITTFHVSGCTNFCGLCNLGGCGSTSTPNGAISRSVWGEQEDRAEASKFVVYDHEFKNRTTRLNNAGEDHIKQIAAVIQTGAQLPVVVERSMNKFSDGKNRYPVDPDPELDNQRRDVIVSALMQMGVQNADELVVVAPAFAQHATGLEAEAAYVQGLAGNRSSGAFGGGFGGFGGFGGGGGGGMGGGISDAPTTDAGSFADADSN
jgi:hypothetical protein